jgi:nucleoside 2-deoxyribosyltransferase
MKIFISWSKAKSKEIAIETKKFLKELSEKIDVFVSEEDIYAGEDVQNKIIKNITECDVVVLCFTKENKKSPWLIFEAGYARALNRNVIPILFDDDPNWHSWIDNPMNVAREIRFNSDEFVTNFIISFDIRDTSINRQGIEKYKQNIIEIKNKFRKVDGDCEELVDRLVYNDAFAVESPFFRDKIAFFLSGFESNELYKELIDYFLYTGKYFWIYGRKNMKLFSGSYKYFFRYLEEKALNENVEMGGISFRCLFLDPSSNETEKAHIQQNLFKMELEATILRAKDIIKNNPTLQKCFKLYSHKRDEIIIRVDNCIIYSRPYFDSNGYPQLLTNTEFEVFSVNSSKGQECIQTFNKVWHNAKEMD